MGEPLCSCCLRLVPLDMQEYVDPVTHYGPGICEICKTFSPLLRQAIRRIKENIAVFWLQEQRAVICEVLFAEVATGSINESVQPPGLPEGVIYHDFYSRLLTSPKKEEEPHG